MEENTKIIVVSTSPESDTYGHELAQQFARGAKAAGLEVDEGEIKRLQETNTMLANRNFAQQRFICRLKNFINHCVKWMKKKKVEFSPSIKNFLKENKL